MLGEQLASNLGTTTIVSGLLLQQATHGSTGKLMQEAGGGRNRMEKSRMWKVGEDPGGTSVNQDPQSLSSDSVPAKCSMKTHHESSLCDPLLEDSEHALLVHLHEQGWGQVGEF